MGAKPDVRRILSERWNQMIQRCTNPKRNNYHNYGGRGIKVCAHWRTFANFFADMGATWRPGLFIERIDNDGDYEPSNCKWTTKKEQCNNKRTNRFIEHDGLRLTVSQWADRLGVKLRLLNVRLSRGWSEIDAITIPVLPVCSGWTMGKSRHKIKHRKDVTSL